MVKLLPPLCSTTLVPLGWDKIMSKWFPVGTCHIPPIPKHQSKDAMDKATSLQSYNA